MSRQNYLRILPQRISRYFIGDKKLQLFLQIVHEFSSRSDAIGVKSFLFWQNLTLNWINLLKHCS